MSRKEICDKVVETFKEFFDNEELALTEETSMDDFEDWDSVAHIQLIFEIEGKLEIQFEAEAIAEMTSIGKIVDIVETMQV